MNNFTRKFENIFAAVAFAEEGEVEMAKQMLEESHAQKKQYSQSKENKIGELRPLRANK
jgi:hypothetical protein